MDGKPGLRDRKKIQTRRLILKCADTLFGKRGFAATTLEDIAGKAVFISRPCCDTSAPRKKSPWHSGKSPCITSKKPARTQPKNQRIAILAQFYRGFYDRSRTPRRPAAISKLVDSDPALTAASLKIQIQYEEALATELSREAGRDPRIRPVRAPCSRLSWWTAISAWRAWC